MPSFDFFGLGKSVKPAPGGGTDDAAPAESGGAPAPKSRTFWLGLLAADGALILACIGLLGARVLHHQAAPHVVVPKRPLPVAQKPAPKPEAAKAEAEPAKSEPKPVAETAKGPEPKTPLGSPGVHAAALPTRSAAPKPAAAKPAPKPAPKPTPTKAAKKKSATKPVTFDYVNPEAEEVSLIGMFLVRGGGSKSMYKSSNGAWKTTVYLNTGTTYRYQFQVVDKSGRKFMTPKKTVDVFE